MKQELCFELGFITKPHGISGELQAQLGVESPEQYQELESVFLEINGKLIPFFIETLTISKSKAIIKFEDIDSIEDASPFSKKKIFVPLELLPELDDDQFYYHEITGYKVWDQVKGELGIVEHVLENPGHDLISMKYKGKEVLIPVTDEIVLEANHQEKVVKVNLPDGLIEIYLEEQEKDDDEIGDSEEDDDEGGEEVLL